MKILIVEDDASSRLFLEKALSAGGHIAESAVNGSHALEKAGQSRPDLIISDIMMPEINGFELCRRIKKDKQLRTIPFIFYTSTYRDLKARQLAMSLGGSRYLEKPMAPNELLKIIDDVMQEQRSRKEPAAGQTIADENTLTEMYSETLAKKLDKKVKDLEKERSALKESEERYRSLIENIDLGISLIDTNHRIIMSNTVQGNYFGVHSDDFIGKFCYREFEKRETICDHCPGVRAMNTGLPSETETEGVRNDGSRFPVLIKAFPVFGQDRVLTGFIELLEDITERRQTEKELRRHRDHLEELVKEQTSELIEINKNLEHEIAERKLAKAESLRSSQLASLGELAAGVAHEINNPINGVINYSQILLNKSTPGTSEHDLALRIIKESERIAGIVNNLLTFAHAREEGRRTVCISETITEALSLTESQLRKDSIIIKVDISPELPTIYAQPQQLMQVFLNIISNSRYALNRKYNVVNINKIIEVTAKKEIVDNLPYLHIIFYDKGTGITPEQKEKLLDPFFSTKPSGEGTGLGLSISNDIITEHGGTITFDSAEGEYTKVNILLPVSQRSVTG